MLDVPIPLYEVPLPLVDNGDEDELEGGKNNNPPGHTDLLNGNKDDDRVASIALSSLIESDEDDDDDDASSTTLGLMADGSGSQPYFQFSDEDMHN